VAGAEPGKEDAETAHLRDEKLGFAEVLAAEAKAQGVA
jgi:hypothetical protein